VPGDEGKDVLMGALALRWSSRQLRASQGSSGERVRDDIGPPKFKIPRSPCMAWDVWGGWGPQ